MLKRAFAIGDEMKMKFTLQPVLNYRQILEGEARQRLAEAQEREHLVSWEITESRDRLNALCRDLDDRQRRGISVADLMLHNARINGVDARLKNLERDLERCRREAVDRRQELCEASRDKKLLERLKEKFGEQQKLFQNRQETIRLDEIFLNLGKGEL
jgi:flagellar FliJ protein